MKGIIIGFLIALVIIVAIISLIIIVVDVVGDIMEEEELNRGTDGYLQNSIIIFPGFYFLKLLN